MTQLANTNYARFLAQKKPKPQKSGFSVDPDALPSKMFGWQKQAVVWSLEQGRSALFEECGLGKSFQQIAWADQVANYAKKPVLILAPLAVAGQTVREGEKLGIEITHARDDSQVKGGVNITNYERLEHFDTSRFAGVVLDESSILKSFSGTTKRALVQSFANTPYRLPCTATPSPNDFMELGNHGEFLGVMPSNEMLARWFINDTASFGSYRLKGHAERDFWEWVASWAVCLSCPSDLTGNPLDDCGYQLPKLNEIPVDIEVDLTQNTDGRLFRSGTLNATGMHREKRLSLSERVSKAAEIANSASGQVVVWCETNDESARLKSTIPDAVEVKGSDSPDAKESRLTAFTEGRARVIVSKPSIAGFGLNWQGCSEMVFTSLTFSFESYYQAVRRCYRFGQKNEVNVHLLAAPTERAIIDTLARKREQHAQMQAQMSAAMRRVSGVTQSARELQTSAGNSPVQVPFWL